MQTSTRLAAKTLLLTWVGVEGGSRECSVEEITTPSLLQGSDGSRGKGWLGCFKAHEQINWVYQWGAQMFPTPPCPLLGSHCFAHTFIKDSRFMVCCCGCLVPHCVQLFATPWTVACQAPLSMGFPRQDYWSGLPFPSPGDLPDPGIKPTSSALAGGFFIYWVSREALHGLLKSIIMYLRLLSITSAISGHLRNTHFCICFLFLLLTHYYRHGSLRQHTFFIL